MARCVSGGNGRVFFSVGRQDFWEGIYWASGLHHAAEPVIEAVCSRRSDGLSEMGNPRDFFYAQELEAMPGRMKGGYIVRRRTPDEPASIGTLSAESVA